MAYFPMFIDLEGRSCLVAGGGNVALRKVEKLLEFGARVTVIAPKLRPELEKMAEAAAVTVVRRAFAEADLTGETIPALVVAATDAAEENHRIAELCRVERIPVNAVDQLADCSFIFPAIAKEQDLVAAFSSGGNSPLLTQYLKKREQEILTPELGTVNAFLGACREQVKAAFATEQERKQAFRSIFEYCMQEGDGRAEERKTPEEFLAELLEQRKTQ